MARRLQHNRFTQVFRRRLRKEVTDDGQPGPRELIDNGAFKITHIVAWKGSQWVYCTEKLGAAIITSAGEGSARYPAGTDWAVLPAQ